MAKQKTASVTVRFFVRIRSGASSGNVYGRIQSGGKIYTFYPGEKCPAAAWDKKRGRPKTGLNNREFIPLAERLKEVESAMLRVWETKQGKFTVSDFKEHVAEELRQQGVKELITLPEFIQAFNSDPRGAFEKFDQLGESSQELLLQFARTLYETPALLNKALGRKQDALSLIDFIPEYLELRKAQKGANKMSVRSIVKYYVHLAAFFHVDGEASYEAIANNFEWRDRFTNFLFTPQKFKFPFPKGRKYFEEVSKRKAKNDFDKAGNYLYDKPAMSTNTVQKAISVLTTFVNEARRRGHTDALIHKGFNVKKVKTNKVTLYANELEKIARLDLAGNDRLEKTRLLLFVGCYTGLRYSDWHKINEHAIKIVEGEKLIEVITEKTKTPVHIPLFDVRFEAMLEACDYEIPKLSGQKFNRYVKELCKLAEINEVVDWIETSGNTFKVERVEKWQKVSSHVGRRTLATMLVDKGYPASTIMGITGHRTEQQFWEYVNIDKRRKAAAISRQMKKAKEESKLKVV